VTYFKSHEGDGGDNNEVTILGKSH